MKKQGRTKWQQAQIDKKCCVVCGKKAVTKVLTLCNIHRKERTKRALKRYYKNKEGKDAKHKRSFKVKKFNIPKSMRI